MLALLGLRVQAATMVNPTAGYTIRRARRDELRLLPAIERAATARFRFTAYPEVADLPPVSEAMHATWLAQDGVWIAQAPSGEIAGFAAWVPLGEDMFVVELDVHPEHGERKLGTQLMDALASLAAARGMPRILLRTFEGLPWYEPYHRRLGFELLSEEDETPELAAIRRHERSVGLDLARRVTLCRRVGS